MHPPVSMSQTRYLPKNRQSCQRPVFPEMGPGGSVSTQQLDMWGKGVKQKGSSSRTVGSGFLFVAEAMRARLSPCVVPRERLAQLEPLSS